MIYETRLRKFQEHIKRSGLDAFVVTFLPDLVYLTELAMEGYWLVATPRQWWVMTNKLLDGAFLAMGVTPKHLRIRMNFKAELEDLLKTERWKIVGFDGEGTFYNLGKYFEGLKFKDKPKFLASLRANKDINELKRIRTACRITAKAMKFIEGRVRPGVSERRLALMIEDSMKAQGAERTSFDLIVGSGPNSAIPHHRTGDRKLKMGDAVVVDIGCVYQNYCSDMTRTFFVGKNPGELFKKVHQTVAESQKKGIQKLKAGLEGRQVDQACRQWIEREGFGEAFTHGTGHGVGIEIHEPPWLRATSQNVLGSGMVVTIEPGIYLDGKLGVRIEDTLLVTPNGAEVLTKV